ncbi:DNA-binding transcriptional regulator, XRE-family HTH domain [Mesonia phycicola]|uniref:DNA-binding transcriptional regulator, XRE-family HTH domain n=1 Tax=Mesonia phycicola TaxID=579105 RepID=A0A1M6AD62_9FLAO|nr:helix-turn-helix domain-containing protein [Mesonia phycicola]SHI34278.1 DNA-binding transcriptional regulator, XRE-family HTH domain [Mesonia phycicola]
MSFFGKNIRKIRNVKNMSQQAFADLFELKRGTLGAYEEGRSEPKIETIILIANYFSISIDAILTTELTVNQLLKFKENIPLDNHIQIKEKFAEIPCITEKNSKDYIDNFDKQNFITELPSLSLPINTDKNFRAYTVMNLEMTNHDQGLYPKDIVIAEFVPKEVYKKLNNGNIVLALINNQLILRRLYIAKNKLILRADHKNIEDLSFKLNEVKELWKVRYVFYKRTPEVQAISTGVEEKLNFLEQEFLKLKNKI